MTLVKQMSGLPPKARDSYKVEVQNLVSAAQELDESLSNWASSLPEDFKFTTHNSNKPNPAENTSSLDGVSATYTLIWHANLWNRYRGAHLIANFNIARVLRSLAIDSDGRHSSKFTPR